MNTYILMCDLVAAAQAVARCCKLTGLHCDYRKSGPSQDVLNQRIETRCQNNMVAAGEALEYMRPIHISLMNC